MTSDPILDISLFIIAVCATALVLYRLDNWLVRRARIKRRLGL